ncbi:MAG: hypothetical protein WBF50_17320, partial [Pseudolabrys sp.]
RRLGSNPTGCGSSHLSSYSHRDLALQQNVSSRVSIQAYRHMVVKIIQTLFFNGWIDARAPSGRAFVEI